jgi:4,5-dihydroxyphthalate decarboxylase
MAVMSGLKLTLTCADYARIMPLVTGHVRPEGIDLTLEIGSNGSWPERAEMLRRAMHDPSVQGGEQSMAGHLIRIAKGDRSFVGLPIFPLRNFTARDLYIRKGGPIHSNHDLVGKRIGMYGWANSGSIWYRHFLRYIGVDPGEIKWCIGPVDAPAANPVPTALPPGVTQPPAGKSLSDMLLSDELDAIYSPPRPARYHPVNGPIARLFPEFRNVEKDYFRRTAAFPPQHLIVLRREVWEANKWIARSVTNAFTRANDMFAASQRGFPYVTPWQEEQLEDTTALMGEDFHSYGLNKNRPVLELFCQQGHAAGLTDRLVSVDEYFAEFLES